MTEGWRTGRLIDFASVSTGPFGSLLHKSDYVSDGVPLVNPINIVGDQITPDPEKLIDKQTVSRLASYILRQGDIVVSRRGELGRCATIGPDESGWVCGTGCFFIRPGNDVEPRFLAAMLRSDRYRRAMEMASTGATMPSVSNTTLCNLPIAIPERNEQRRIVALLDEAFAGIATAKANAEKSLRCAREVFEKALAHIFSGHHAGWKAKRLHEVCAITAVLVDPREPKYLDALHVGAGNIESKTGKLFDVKTSREEALISGKFPFDETMVLYSKIRPYLEKVARPSFGGICSADMYPLAPIEGEVTRDFLYWLLLSKPFTDYAIKGSARAGMPKVNREHLFKYKIEIPGVLEQERIASKLDGLQAEISRIESIYTRKVAALEELKQSLLQRAFSGQL